MNECAANNGGCALLSSCTNTPGSRTCGHCPTGYTGTGDTACTDIDECATNNGGCDTKTTCTNTPGSRTCGACPTGYNGPSTSGCYRYGFETGVEGWSGGSGIAVTSSSDRADTGTMSLKVTLGGVSSEIHNFTPATGLAQGTFSFRIYVPSTTTLTALQPFDMTNGSPPAYDWKGSWKDTSASNIPRNSWRTITVTLPTTSTGGLARKDPFGSLGIQLNGTGDIYIDTFTY